MTCFWKDLVKASQICPVGSDLFHVWAAEGSLLAVRYNHGGSGDKTAALVFGGYDDVAVMSSTEIYNGSSWSASSAMSQVRNRHAGCGSTSATIAVGGYSGTGGGDRNQVDAFNGSSWSLDSWFEIQGADLSLAGTATSAIAMGGNIGTTPFVETNIYSSPSWSAGPNMNTSRQYRQGAAGTSTSTFIAGDLDSETYDGVSWTSGPSLLNTNGRDNTAGAGTVTAAVVFGGWNSTDSELDTAEEYDAVTFSAGGTMSVTREKLTGAGDQSTALAAGGGGDSPWAVLSSTESYS